MVLSGLLMVSPNGPFFAAYGLTQWSFLCCLWSNPMVISGLLMVQPNGPIWAAYGLIQWTYLGRVWSYSIVVPLF